jgi:hypothetical protein
MSGIGLHRATGGLFVVGTLGFGWSEAAFS